MKYKNEYILLRYFMKLSVLGAFLSLQATPCFNVQAIVQRSGDEVNYCIPTQKFADIISQFNPKSLILQWELGSDHWTIKDEKRNCE